MPRYPDLSYERLDPEQRQVYDRIAAGPRGSVGGPFGALLRSPLLCDRVQQVGQFIRFESCLPGRVRELAILMTARHWRAQYEWYAHCRLARAEGLDDAIIDAVRDGVDLPLDDPALQATREFASSLLSSGRVADDVHARATALFGDRGVVELVTTVGYYCLVSLVLNTAEVPVPAGNELLPDR
jgi:4-carboxymuconolactone decarboxylase